MVGKDGKKLNPIEELNWIKEHTEIVFTRAALVDLSFRLLHLLDESVRLQSHYASLLNMHDGGERIVFKSAKEWADRIEELN